MAMRSILLIVGILGLPFFFHACSEAATFTIKNNCPYTIWPATVTNPGSQLRTTGFELPSGASNSISVPKPWSGRVWARTQCSTSNGRFTCVTGDCGSGSVGCNGASGAPPASLAELTLGGTDYYDISIVDGFNLPVTVAPQGGSGTCNPQSCPSDVNRVCPNYLAVKDRNGGVVGCKSACVAFGKPEYCCTGAYMETCQPTYYSQIFKNKCPQAYTYARDDKSTVACSGANYLITFCP